MTMNMLRCAMIAGVLGVVAGSGWGQVTLLTQDRSISLQTAADGFVDRRIATDFGVFASSITRRVVVPDPFGPVDTGGDVNISCHFEGGIDLIATMTGWSLDQTGTMGAPVTGEVSLDVEFLITQPTPIRVVRHGLGDGTSLDEIVEISLQRLDSQRRPIINDSGRGIGSSANHATLLQPGEYQFRFSAILESSGESARREVLLEVRFGAESCLSDMNQDGGTDGADINAFFTTWEEGHVAADVNQDGGVDGADVQTFVEHWESGC